MDRPSPASVLTSSAEPPDTRLRGTRLFVARAVWVTLCALNLASFGLALVSQVAAIEHPCVDPNCPVTPAQAESLRHLGIGLGAFAAYYTGIPTLIVVADLILAVLLFWRRSDDWLALVVGLFLLYPVAIFALGPNNVVVSALILPLYFADAIIYYGVFLIFPGGRFVPRWAWLLLAAWAGQHLAGVIAILGGVNSATIPFWVGITYGITYPVLYLSALAIQVYRYRRVSDARQRQQTKWVVLGVAVALLANITYWIVLPLAVPAFQQPDSFYYAVAFPLYELATIALPISFALAIQRHQLFDVDVLIKRTLVYGTLTVILAAVYFGVVIGAQAAVGTVDPQASQSPVIVVASTLLIAALFTPLRRGLQAGIDRRFYRSKYDAARTLEAFAATLRTETDLNELSEHLVAVVRETMQPASVSLWLRESVKMPTTDRTLAGN
jgi:hypothetical protein